jgi:hypothetical protein
MVRIARAGAAILGQPPLCNFDVGGANRAVRSLSWYSGYHLESVPTSFCNIASSQAGGS